MPLGVTLLHPVYGQGLVTSCLLDWGSASLEVSKGQLGVRASIALNRRRLGEHSDSIKVQDLGQEPMVLEAPEVQDTPEVLEVLEVQDSLEDPNLHLEVLSEVLPEEHQEAIPLGEVRLEATPSEEARLEVLLDPEEVQVPTFLRQED